MSKSIQLLDIPFIFYMDSDMFEGIGWLRENKTLGKRSTEMEILLTEKFFDSFESISSIGNQQTFLEFKTYEMPKAHRYVFLLLVYIFFLYSHIL